MNKITINLSPLGIFAGQLVNFLTAGTISASDFFYSCVIYLLMKITK